MEAEVRETNDLKPGENHPGAHSALRYLRSLGFAKLMLYQESFASCAIEGNRLAELCSETMSRLLKHEPIGERYLMGLAWSIRNMEDGVDDDFRSEEEIPTVSTQRRVAVQKGEHAPERSKTKISKTAKVNRPKPVKKAFEEVYTQEDAKKCLEK